MNRRRKLLLLLDSGLRAFFASLDFRLAADFIKQPRRSALDLVTQARTMGIRGAGVTGTYLPVQGNVAGTAGDVFSYPRGTIVGAAGSKVYDSGNSNQGGVAVLFEIPFAGNDGLLHVIVQTPTITIVKTAANQIQVTLPDGTSTITTTGGTVAGWAIASKHLALVEWDADNIVTGTSYSALTLDNTATVGPTAALTVAAPAATAYLGSNNGLNALGGPGLYFLYEQPSLFTTAGKTALWNGGAFASPDRVMANQEGASFWVPGARAASGPLSGSVPTEGCFDNLRLYAAGTNDLGNRLTNGTFEAAYGAPWTDVGAGVGSIGATAARLAGMGDLGVLVVTNTGGVNGGSQQIVAAAAGTSWAITGLLATIDATSADLSVYSGTDGALTTLLFTSTNATTTPAKAAGCFTVAAGHNGYTVLATATGADTKAARFDNLIVKQNKVTNGSFDDGAFAKTGAAITTSGALAVVASLGGTSYTITAAGAWDLSLAVVGMILYGETGTEVGFITAVDDVGNVVTADFAAGAPGNLQAFGVYSALAPGWSVNATGRAFRSTDVASGTYAQGFIPVSAGDGITQTITTTSGVWYCAMGRVKTLAGSAAPRMNPLGGTAVDKTAAGTAAYTLFSAVSRASAATQVLNFIALGTVTGSQIVVDSAAVIPLDPIQFTANYGGRTETDGTNMFGADTNSIPSAGLLPAPVVLGTTASLQGYFDTLDTSAFVDGPLGTALQAYPDGSVLEFYDGTNYALARKGANGTGELTPVDLNTDPGFDTDLSWTKGSAGWTIAGSKAVANATGAAKSITLTPGVTFVIGGLYKAVLVCDALTSGQYKIWFGTNAGAIGHTTSGTKTEYYTSVGGTNLGIYAATDLTATFTSLSNSRVTAPASTGVLLLKMDNATRGMYKAAAWNPNLPQVVRVLNPASLQGSVVGTFTPRGWTGADGREHVVFDTSGTTNRIQLVKQASNSLRLLIYDATGTVYQTAGNVTALTLPDGVIARYGISMNAGVTKLVLNGVELTTLTGTGANVLTALPTTFYFGSSSSGGSELDATNHKTQFFATAKTAAELTAAANGL